MWGYKAIWAFVRYACIQSVEIRVEPFAESGSELAQFGSRRSVQGENFLVDFGRQDAEDSVWGEVGGGVCY